MKEREQCGGLERFTCVPGASYLRGRTRMRCPQRRVIHGVPLLILKFEVAFFCSRYGALHWEASLDHLIRFTSVLVPKPRWCAAFKAGGVEELLVPWPADANLQNSGPEYRTLDNVVGCGNSPRPNRNRRLSRQIVPSRTLPAGTMYSSRSTQGLPVTDAFSLCSYALRSDVVCASDICGLETVQQAQSKTPR